LRALLGSLKRRFGIEQAIFVFDNGMSSTLNLPRFGGHGSSK
jgi:hypothetical protein